MSFEYCRLVLDRPAHPGQHGLVYLEKKTGDGMPSVVASSSAFDPELDPGAHAAARGEVEAQLVSDGWQRMPNPPAVLVGARFQRRLPVTTVRINSAPASESGAD